MTPDVQSESSSCSGNRGNLFYWEREPLYGFKDRSDINVSVDIYPYRVARK